MAQLNYFGGTRAEKAALLAADLSEAWLYDDNGEGVPINQRVVGTSSQAGAERGRAPVQVIDIAGRTVFAVGPWSLRVGTGEGELIEYEAHARLRGRQVAAIQLRTPDGQKFTFPISGEETSGRADRITVNWAYVDVGQILRATTATDNNRYFAVVESQA